MTFFELSKEVERQFQNGDVEDAAFSAQEIVLHVGEIPRERWIIEKDREAKESEVKKLNTLVIRRINGEPLQYLIGEWDFYGRPFSVGEGVLIPRADTEIMIDAVKECFPTEKPLVFADLCSGSGAIGLTLSLEFPQSEGWLVEKSPEAFNFLKINKERNSIDEKRTHELLLDVLDAQKISEYFALSSLDLIVSNPPYLTDQDMDRLQEEVKYEPSMALYGGQDGLLFYRGISEIWGKFLRDGGSLYFEVGIHQADPVKAILKAKGFEEIRTYADLQGIPRIVSGKKPCKK